MLEDVTNIAMAVGILVGALILSFLVGVLLRLASKRVFAKTATRLDDVMIESVTGPLRIAIVVLGVELALRQVEVLPEDWRGPLGDFFFVVYLGLVYVAVFQLIHGLTEWYKEEVASRTETELDDKFLSFFRALANILVTALFVIVLLGHFGIEPSALVATLGISTLAVALAAQETLRDIISGFMIMLDQPFAVGDRVEIQDIDTWGDVTEIGLRSTRILTRDNRMVAVPNSVIGKGLVINYSDPNTVYRVQTHVGIAYGTDIDEARRVMVEAIRAEDWVMKDRKVEALMLEFGDSALVFRVRCWIEHYVETRRVIDKMNTALYRALDQAGIVIPMPQRAVELTTVSVRPEKDFEVKIPPGD
jgi:small-conductance mechanosensitive channel